MSFIRTLRKFGGYFTEKEANPPLRRHTHTAFCFDCKVRHDVYDDADYLSDWKQKHLRCKSIGMFPAAELPALFESLKGNSDVKAAFQAEQSMTVTNLHSLASSATAGWTSASVDNSSNLYLNALVMVHIAAVNTAPGSDQAIYLFAYGSTDGSIFTSTGTSGGAVGTEGSLTFPSVATLPCVMPSLGTIPYPVQNKALDAGPFSVAACFGGVLPQYWGVALVNYAGFTFAASGNTVKYRGVYNTVI